MDLIFFVSLFIVLVTLFSAVDLFRGIRSMTHLSQVATLSEGEMPLVSLIVPACNEEEHIGEAIATHLQQSYSNIEIIAVNDRSTDDTLRILRQIESEDNRLVVIDIGSLPDGWMGKTNALQTGAAMASGEYLLFSDADILMGKTAISRAVNHMLRHKRDHISVIFKNVSSGWLLNSLILDSGAGLMQMFRPWRAHRPSSSNFMGVGAFNLVKRDVYTAIDGHRRIRMHPIDDIMLGKIIKSHGYSQECLLGPELVKVPWYASIGEMVNGLMKNVMAMINYRYSLLLPLVFAILLLNILPLWGVILAGGYARLLFISAVALKISAFYTGTRLLGISRWCALGVLLTPYISLYIIVRAAWLNYRDGGIYWRGTHYSLRQLRKNMPILP